MREVKRAQILLAADAGSTDEEIADTVKVAAATVYRTRRRFVEEGIDVRSPKIRVPEESESCP